MTLHTPEEGSRASASYTEETRRLDTGHGAGWVGGVVLIVLGAVFLLHNITGVELFDNWWALFLFIPAAVLGARAHGSYRQKGYLDRAALGALSGALFPAAIGVFFLLGLDFGLLWPVMLILAGVAVLVNGGALGGGR
jgi:hypothetical protein